MIPREYPLTGRALCRADPNVSVLLCANGPATHWGRSMNLFLKIYIPADPRVRLADTLLCIHTKSEIWFELFGKMN